MRKKRLKKKYEKITMGKENRIRDEKHRRFIASLPCCVTGLEGETQCAHVSEGRHSIGMKSGDNNCLPLSVDEHRIQHEIGEQNYWFSFGGLAKAKRLANNLYDVSGDMDAALALLESFP
jgi:hypothetical protein